MKPQLVAAIIAFGAASAAYADRPPSPPKQMEQFCSTSRSVCAHVDRRAGRTTVQSSNATTVPWSIATAPPAIALADDGRTLVEIYRPGGLLEAGDNAATVLLIIRNHEKEVRRVTLSDLILNPDRLPRTVSHRQWARVAYLDPRGEFVVATPEGREIRVTAAGQITTTTIPGGDGPDWYKRYAQPIPKR